MSDLQIIRPFGPSIAKITMPDELIKNLNNYIDKTILDEEKVSKLDHSNQLAGKVKQEFLLENKFMEEIKWGEFLGKAVKTWLQHDAQKQLKSFEIIKCWIVRQFKNEYNPIHHHSGHVSGVGYLKVPKHLGDISEKKKINDKGRLTLIHGSVNLFSKATYVIKPEVGDFYLFPNYLLHTVYPFSDTDEERRSISFNANLDRYSASYSN
jgi:hypothetical protein|tara:strand:- start:77 stop:703 length:627 start_codon:yes stop_codon:yes gene_type:complete